MAGRKTIMVENPVWENIDHYKHDIYARSIGDAIVDAVDIASSKTFYACVHNVPGYYSGKSIDNEKYWNSSLTIESSGRTEKEAIRNLQKRNNNIDESEILDDKSVSEYKDCYFVTKVNFKTYYDAQHIDELENCGVQLKALMEVRKGLMGSLKKYTLAVRPISYDFYVALFSYDETTIVIETAPGEQTTLACFISDVWDREYNRENDRNTNITITGCTHRFYSDTYHLDNESIFFDTCCEIIIYYRKTFDSYGNLIIDTTPNNTYYALIRDISCVDETKIHDKTESGIKNKDDVQVWTVGLTPNDILRNVNIPKLDISQNNEYNIPWEIHNYKSSGNEDEEFGWIGKCSSEGSYSKGYDFKIVECTKALYAKALMMDKNTSENKVLFNCSLKMDSPDHYIADLLESDEVMKMK